MEKTVYRIMMDSIEITANSMIDSSRRVGKPFPRNLSSVEIMNIYMNSGREGKKIAGDYSDPLKAMGDASKIRVSSVLYDWNVPFVKSEIVTVDEYRIVTDEDGETTEEYTGNFYFSVHPYTHGATP